MAVSWVVGGITGPYRKDGACGGRMYGHCSSLPAFYKDSIEHSALPPIPPSPLIIITQRARMGRRSLTHSTFVALKSNNDGVTFSESPDGPLPGRKPHIVSQALWVIDSMGGILFLILREN